MALTETVRWYIGINDEGVLELRRTRVIMDGEEIIGEKHHRVTLYPGDSTIATYPLKVRQVANLIWTPAIIAAYEAKKAAAGA